MISINSSLMMMMMMVIELCRSTSLPGIGQLLRGYNVFYGNPNPSESTSDPGYQSQIFSTNFSNGETGTFMGNTYQIPNGITANPQIQCECSADFHLSYGMQSYHDSLSSSVSASGVEDGIFFSASASWDYVYTQTKVNTNVVSKSTISCQVYYANIQQNTPPYLTNDFIIAIQKLPLQFNSSNMDIFVNFFGTADGVGYGTHIITKTYNGAELGQYVSMNYQNYQLYESSTFSTSDSAKFACAKQFGATFSASEDTAEAEKYISISEDRKEYSLGVYLPAGSVYESNGCVDGWTQNIYTKGVPSPLKIYVINIYSFLNNNIIFNRQAKQFNMTYSQYQQKMAALKNAYIQYCKYLEQQKPNSAIYCSSIPPDGPYPEPSVFAGIYVSNSNGAVTNNVYTNGQNCPPPTQQRVFFIYKTSGGTQWQLHYCLNTNYTNSQGLLYDPMNSFGGIYTITIVNQQASCVYANLFTGGCTCPSQYEANVMFIATQDTKMYIHMMYCWDVNTYKSSTSEIGGFYVTGHYPENNPVTGTTSCPYGYTSYVLWLNWQCMHDSKGTQHHCNLYYCLNNVWS